MRVQSWDIQLTLKMYYHELSPIYTPKEGDLWKLDSQYTIEWNAAHHTFQNTSYIDILLFSERFDLIKNISRVPLQRNRLTVTVDETWKSTSHHSFLSIGSSTSQSRSVPIQIVLEASHKSILTKRDVSSNKTVIVILAVAAIVVVSVLCALLYRRWRRSKSESNSTELNHYPPPPPYSTDDHHHHSIHVDHCHVRMDHGGYSSHDWFPAIHITYIYISPPLFHLFVEYCGFYFGLDDTRLL